MQGIAQALERFLANHAGTATDIAATKRYNHQNLRPPGDGLLTCLTVRVEFRNSGIFGSKGPFLTEVYPRYRFLRRRLTEFLAHQGISTNEPSSDLAISLVPSAALNSYLGDALPQDAESSRGASILPIEALTQYSEYYRRLASRYKIDQCLLTNKSTVVGPDAGILATACVAAQTFPGRIRVVEFGTGAGTTALTLSNIGKLSSYTGNDFSPEATEFFCTYVKPKLAQVGIRCEFVSGPCFDLEVSNLADLIIVGVFYQAQPDLVKIKGSVFSKALSGGGILIAQSSKTENPFVTELLNNNSGRHALWPWYDDQFSIDRYFAHVAKVDVHGESMLIATNDGVRLGEISALLQQEVIAMAAAD